MDLKKTFGLLAQLLLLSLCITPMIASAQTAFTDATNASGVAHSSETYGASWGDPNGDGFPDLFVNNHRTTKSLFVNQGNGRFVDIAPTINNFKNRPNADTHGATWADFNNVGSQDLLIILGGGNLPEWYVNQNGKLIYSTVGSGLDIPGAGGRMSLWLDYDNDHRLDVLVTEDGGVGRLFHQNTNATFTEMGSAANMTCAHFAYAQLLDVNDDGRLDVLCPAAAAFPQKIYDTSTFPWTTLFDSASPAAFLPVVHDVVDSAIADFNNDGHMDLFLLGGVENRPSSVVQGGTNRIEAMLAGGNKGFQFVSTGLQTFTINWTKVAEGSVTDLTKIQIGASGINPTATTFTLDPANPAVAGMPPAPTPTTVLPLMQIGYDTTAHRWTLTIVTKVGTNSTLFSEGYIQVASTTPITGLKATGLWITDMPSRPTLLMNRSGTFVDETVAAHLDTPVQCGSVTAGDFDNDMYVDLYLSCRTGASNIANILYHNNGDGTFTAVPNAGGAAGPIGLAIGDGAGTADSVVSGDYDVDGFLDLFVTNGFNIMPLYIGGPNKLFHNNGNANHWIELDLVGVNSDRDATGARVYASALGVTQFRVQDGRYHRWSQDAKRIHFGLAGATAANITVKWPSGTEQTFPNVAANKLYTVTEGAASPVPANLCGAPSLKGATDAGVFIWKDCSSGYWMLRTAGAGGAIAYTGTVTSSAPYISIAGSGLTQNDVVNFTTQPPQITFTIHAKRSATPGFNFLPAGGTSNCLSITAPTSTPVYFGHFRVLEPTRFNLETQASC